MPASSSGHLYAPIASVKPADVAIGGDGTTLYVAGDDGNVRVYDLATRALEATWDVGTALGAIDLSPDGQFLLVSSTTPPPVASLTMPMAPAPPRRSTSRR
jgi:DNA-binding beta-propeller fold protein YncE